mmetsp:Transcript_12435/g.25778  ORF Transcript_12435/g.25778 Transcript_12435/m.25778 type:complete len:126 (+) Transcript_12435:74-451(+)
MPATAEQEETWLPVPHKSGCLIINSGDQIAQLTNDYYRSALHRVVIGGTKGEDEPFADITPKSSTRDNSRFSTAIFTYFGMQARVGPLPQFLNQPDLPREKYPTPYRTSQEYFHFKLKESTGKAY